MRNRAGWLALSVLAVATLLMVFFVLPRISDQGQQLTDKINEAGETVKEAVTQKQETETGAAAPATGASTDVASAPPIASPPDAPQPPASTPVPEAASQAPATSAAPAFDVLRVEPNGSTVIAGRAEPDATVEVAAGDKIIAAIKAGPSGDFAIVLDQPLPAGDHQLVLRATGKNGETVLSDETATVSVPETKDGKLLAMVTKPGKASRLINVPAAGNTDADVASLDTGNASPEFPELPGAASDLVATAPPISPPLPAAAPERTHAQNPVADIQISAVEIEGSRLFIAGRAPSGASLLGFANDQTVGRAKATNDGNFVIEGVIDLPVGNHTIAVELMDGAGKTALRVEVPFNRPAGAQVAAVAGQNGPSSVSAIDGGAFDKLRDEAARAFALLKGLYGNGRQPSAEELAAARSGTVIALKSLSEYRLPAGASADARDIVDRAARQAGEALAAIDGLPAQPEAVGTALPELASTIEAAVGPVIAESGDTGNGASEQAAATGPKTIEQAPLTQARNSVIIRRGDTLWQISRRVYGQGVRYTTIYLANQDQINNPDLIEPGQIFGVPDEALPDAEELHRKRLQKQQR
ncbi:putative peptidoglycan binding protein (LysM domain involved in cell wall degradation) [Pseudorhizobium banfieldiae]|uniref:Putative peptidoglycan binding protein (LysM domain involved in cell wall degradation) n=2 Tax=Pseudorhizobium banfieldiae TaxID=1125847 RepID=L0NCN6_9HYPH|nr:Ig-like domain-containing protein [Pseudorhizobium banfieldiae]CAD6603853.1 LysM peptidoglycan-binding domain-containing protein [arsenite-oxidising bacterium NT-25]CCF18820.1 putative peptidoglycan binding protein (LysM domain involved in cell wall degradation) [Pseudorhizobium banfieldiae]